MADLIREYSTSNITTPNIGQTVDQLMVVAKDSRRGFEKRWYDNNFFDDGFHFRYLSRQENKVYDLSAQSSLWEPLRAIPKASRQIRGVANLLMSQDPVPVVYPEKVSKIGFSMGQEVGQNGQPGQVNPEYQQALDEAKRVAQLSGHWLSEEYKKQDLIEKLALAVILSAKHGVSYLQIWPDAVEEAIRTQVLDAFDIFLIGSLTEICDSPFIIKATPRLISQIKADENFDEEQKARINPDNRLASSEIKEAYMRARYGSEGNADETATLLLKEAFIKEYLGDKNRDRIRSSDNGAEILKDKKDGDPVIRHTFVAGNIWLRDEYVDLPDYPFVDYRFEPGPIYQVPLIERFIPTNKSLDMAVSRLEKFFHTMNVGVWLKRAGEQFNITNQSGGQVIEYQGTPPVQGAVTSPSAMSFPFVSFLESLIEEQGVSTSTLAKVPRGVKAHAAIESLKESEIANLVIAQRRLKETVKKVSEKMLDIADGHFVTPQTVYYLEKGEPQYFDVIGGGAIKKRSELKIETDKSVIPLKKEYLVDIEIESGLAYTREGQKAAAKELMDFMLQVSQIGLIGPEVIKIFTQRLLEIYKFGPTQEIMDAIDDFNMEGQLSDSQMEKIKVGVLEVMKDLQKVGFFPSPEQRIEEEKIATAEVIRDTGGGQRQPNEETKPPNQSISFRDLPPSGKAQMAAQAGIQLTPEDLALQQAQEAAKTFVRDKGQQTGGGNNA